MAACNPIIGALVQTVSSNPVAASNIRNLAKLWDSGLTASLLSNISDPLSDSSADAEALELVERYVARKQPASPRRLQLAELIRYQAALQTSSRLLSKIAMLTK
ncbi:MAG: hypothetical protein JWO13_3734 [Acidobacteriales bacterium]|nr:hypothetical protein [Terriglobales bacterium]